MSANTWHSIKVSGSAPHLDARRDLHNLISFDEHVGLKLLVVVDNNATLQHQAEHAGTC